MRMSLLNRVIQRMGGGIALALLAVGVFGSAPALAAGITDTKHNLSTSGTGVNKMAAGGTAEICVFCHTPHGSDTSAVVPLWNKKLGDPATYTTYNSLGTSSLDGSTAPVGSVSLACLSCHDGSQALNVMINAPGSNGYVVGGAVVGAMEGVNQTSNMLKAGLITNLGTDLRNDHPVGIQYAGGPNGAIPAAGSDYTAFKDTDFKSAKSMTANNQTVWWVDTSGGTNKAGSTVGGTDGTREKTDMQLYTRKQADTAIGGVGTVQPFVECASCHDPHSDNNTFLRIENKASAVCLSCHIK